MQTVLALICKGVHNHGIEEFTDRLNEALNPDHHRDGSARDRKGTYDEDVDYNEVEELLEHILENNKAALALIRRQWPPRLTRRATLAFQRKIPFTGTQREWLVDGRVATDPLVRDEQRRKYDERMRRGEENDSREHTPTYNRRRDYDDENRPDALSDRHREEEDKVRPEGVARRTADGKVGLAADFSTESINGQGKNGYDQSLALRSEQPAERQPEERGSSSGEVRRSPYSLRPAPEIRNRLRPAFQLRFAPSDVPKLDDTFGTPAWQRETPRETEHQGQDNPVTTRTYNPLLAGGWATSFSPVPGAIGGAQASPRLEARPATGASLRGSEIWGVGYADENADPQELQGCDGKADVSEDRPDGRDRDTPGGLGSSHGRGGTTAEVDYRHPDRRR